MIVQTTTLGRKIDKTVETMSQTAICCFIEVPIQHRVLIANRLSSPVVAQVRHTRSAPNSSTMISEKYWLMICCIGTRSNSALTAIGTKAVTEILTGRSIHHSAIQTAVPSAAACLKPKNHSSRTIVSTKLTGPSSTAILCSLRLRLLPYIKNIPFLLPNYFYCRMRI